MKLEVVNGRDWCTGSAYKEICHIKSEPLAVMRVVYKDENGRLWIRHKGKYIEVRKEGMRYYEV